MKYQIKLIRSNGSTIVELIDGSINKARYGLGAKALDMESGDILTLEEIKEVTEK